MNKTDLTNKTIVKLVAVIIFVVILGLTFFQSGNHKSAEVREVHAMEEKQRAKAGVAESQRKEEETRIEKVRELLGDEIPFQVDTIGGHPTDTMFNTAFKNVKTYINRKTGILSISFEYDPAFYPSLSDRTRFGSFRLLVRLFDQNGQYLTHFNSSEIFVVTGNPNYSRRNFTLLKPKGNFVRYQINLRDAVYVGRLEFGAVGSWGG